MYRKMGQPRRRGFSLFDLIEMTAGIGLLMALLLPAIQRVREAANRMACGNNLKQIGVAFHNYHADYKSFPAGGITAAPDPRKPETGSIFWRSRDYMELKAATTSRFPARVFVCPSRRTPQIANGKHDYCYASLGAADTNDPKSVFALWQDRHTLGSKLEVISNGDGSAVTILLSHKGMPAPTITNPSTQTGDLLWQDPAAENFVRPAATVWRQDPPQGIVTTELVGAPHPARAPVLMADLQVKNLRYGLAANDYAAAWSYNGVQPGATTANGKGEPAAGFYE